ncbi:MAG: alpha/beta fold hydrolase [Flavitalea sp.]
MNRRLHYFLLLAVLVSYTMVSCRKTIMKALHPGEAEVPQLVEKDPPILTPVTFAISNSINGFYSSVPARYFESTYKYPLILFFHGGGQYGNGSTDLYKVLQDAIPKLQDEKIFPPSFMVNGRSFSFITISPQFVRSPSNTDIRALLDYVKANYRVDISRVYLVGFSLGARFLSNFAAVYPTEIAAVVSMAGMPQITSTLAGKAESIVNAHLPIWHAHNRDDSAWYYSESVKYIQQLNSLNPLIPPRFTTFDVGTARLHHDCWTKLTDPAYKEDDKNIYEWMLEYYR